MPGPFPGMDPYLESPEVWRNVHNRLITYIGDRLNEVLPPEYVATTDERLYVVPWDQHIYPDATIVSRSRKRVEGNVAVLEASVADEPLHLAIRGDARERESFIEIRTAGPESRAIVSLEVISPSNKSTGRGYEEYNRKQRQVLDSGMHLVEIDLLRAGKHTAAAPREAIVSERGLYHYLASLHFGGGGNRFDVWAWSVRDRMPRIAIPLEPGVSDVVLDLQIPFDRNYDAGRFPQQIDYRKDPDPPFTGEDAAWIDSLLREKGLRD